MELNKLKNPYIRVIWEDTNENLTNEKIKRVKTYFEQKYKSKSVKIIPKVKKNKDEIVLTSLDATQNILDNEYQKTLIKDYIKENNITIDWEMLNRLDNKVNLKLSENNTDKIKYNKWEILSIEFSNFLSYGDNNEIDYTTLNGITNIESSPRNFGGKTTAFINLLMFLFFNKTDKTKTNAEIFNTFRNKDEVFVKGKINIDNETYIIERTLLRKINRKQEYDVTSRLEFFKFDENNIAKNLNGEQRRETEKLIASAIGDEEDFLMTILTTGQNLEDLIDSKPTARGNILTKFIGLEVLKEKEEIAKTMYNEWSKKLTSNSHNITNLKSENEKLLKNNEDNKLKLIYLKDLIDDDEKLVLKRENENELLLRNRKSIDENDLLLFNQESNEKEIILNENKIKELNINLGNILVVEPSKYYLESEHTDLKNKLNDLKLSFNFNHNTKVNNIKTKDDLEHATVCPTCKRALEGVNYDEEIKNIDLLIEKLTNDNILINKEIEEIKNKDIEYNKLKAELELYEKNKLLKTRCELEIEQKQLIIDNLTMKLDRYKLNKLIIEENKKIDLTVQTNKSYIQTLRGTIKGNIENLERFKNEISTFTLKISQNEELIKKILSEEQLVSVFKVYLSIFGKNGISKVILRNVIPSINDELFGLLIDSCYFTVELLINDKNEIEFIMIDNETRVTKSLSSGSGYEKTIASLALRSALTKISVLPKPNIMVMDEIFGKVADENLDMVGEFFKKIKNYFQHIIVISHNPLIKNWSDNNILIVKENNISQIK